MQLLKNEINQKQFICHWNFFPKWLDVCVSVAHPPGVGEVIVLILGPNRFKAKNVKSCTYCLYVRCVTLILWVGGMPWPKTCATQYHAIAQLGLPGRAIKGMAVCNSWDLESWDLLNGLALGWYQLSPEVWLVCVSLVKYICKWNLRILFQCMS